MANPNDTDIVTLESLLEAERAHRAALPISTPEDALEPSCRRSDALEDAILWTTATSPAGFAVKLREIKRQLAAEGCVSRWIESLERDLAQAYSGGWPAH